MTEERLKELLRMQSLGDEDAVEELAAHMSGTGATADAWADAQSWANQFRKDFILKNSWEASNPDIRDNPDVYALAVRLDSRLAQKRPDLELKDRLNLVTDVLREEVGDVEGFHNSQAIAQIAGSRNYHDHNGRTRVQQDEKGNLVFDESQDTIGDDLRAEDQMRSNAISEILQERSRLRQEAGQRAAESPEPQKMRRMYPHAPR